ncbi:putative SorC-family transcriptional regulator [Klebsiella michiganensis]|nr:putative SorC-family transcriptional regulator [Klebsiella michiganensis]
MPAFNEESTLDSVSFGCYQLMARYLQDDKEKIIGLGSGLTLKKALQRIDFDSLNTRCVALISAMDADGQCNYYDDVPLLLTSKIKAKYYQWPAPRYAQTQDEYDMWCTSRLFSQRFRRRPPGGRYFCRHWAIRYPKPHLQRWLYQSGADG